MESRTILEALKSHQIDTSDLFSSLTSCGEIHSDFVYKGCYAFNFSLGVAQVYILHSERYRKYNLYTRSYRPVNSNIFRVLSVSDEKGFLIFQTGEFKTCVQAFMLCVNQLIKQLVNSPSLFQEEKFQGNLFNDYLLSQHSEDFHFELSV